MKLKEGFFHVHLDDYLGKTVTAVPRGLGAVYRYHGVILQNFEYVRDSNGLITDYANKVRADLGYWNSIQDFSGRLVLSRAEEREKMLSVIDDISD